jgi:hypothetical protein
LRLMSMIMKFTKTSIDRAFPVASITSGVCVDVEPTQTSNPLAPLRLHDCGVGPSVFFDDGQLDLGPNPDLVILDRHNKTLSECLNKGKTWQTQKNHTSLKSLVDNFRNPIHNTLNSLVEGA